MSTTMRYSQWLAVLSLAISASAFAAEQTLDEFINTQNKPLAPAPAIGLDVSMPKPERQPSQPIVYGKKGNLEVTLECDQIEVTRRVGEEVCGWKISQITNQTLVLKKGKKTKNYLIGLPVEATSTTVAVPGQVVPPIPMVQ